MNLDGVLDELVERIAQRVVEKLAQGDEPTLIDQRRSPLGNRRHIALIKSGKLRGRRVGRSWIARSEDIAAFVAANDAEQNSPPPKLETLSDLERKLGFRK